MLCKITLDTTMTLAQLAVLLNTIHRISDQYNALQYNCYWYTYTLREVIKQEFNCFILSDECMSKRGLWGNINLMKEDLVDQVILDYNTAWGKVEKKITENKRMQQV